MRKSKIHPTTEGWVKIEGRFKKDPKRGRTKKYSRVELLVDGISIFSNPIRAIKNNQWVSYTTCFNFFNVGKKKE